ncbi:ATP-binding protein [Rhizobium ruizarguesonis]|uniref:ATP-binding protein n=1 Tax=Rhizobium ruizarguesonis TaxID=2081791 RepID=UPI0013C006A6|nr:ATP-binding protein [Rhizobium ruizarguesonis]NEH32626.1 hypothetical protein [Rhizobium ruizarguesonis]NEK13133.1 hypothetical protein [Rhizobium ruizarguesonis]
MELRDLLIKNVSKMFPVATFVLDFQNLVEGIKPGTSAAIIPVSPGTTIDNIVNVVVDRALLEGWIGAIVAQLPRNPATAAELDVILAQLRDQPRPTCADPFEEVLLEGTRPFANRVDLRMSLRALCETAGSPILLVTGEARSGKSFSFYLAQHIARQRAFITSQFDVGVLIDPATLATEVLRRFGVELIDDTTGLESDQRSGQALAAQVNKALQAQKQRRLLVFDGFPSPSDPPLPPETMSFIVRLARYADEELHPFLRILLIRFHEPLPDELDDVAERDEAQGFTDADMLSVLKQIANARGWNVSDQALLDEINQVSGKTLRERFQLMRKTIRRLSQMPAPAGAPQTPGGPL